MLVQPAMSRFNPKTLQAELAIVPTQPIEWGEIAVDRLKRNEGKVGDCRESDKTESRKSPRRMRKSKNAQRRGERPQRQHQDQEAIKPMREQPPGNEDKQHPAGDCDQPALLGSGE